MYCTLKLQVLSFLPKLCEKVKFTVDFLNILILIILILIDKQINAVYDLTVGYPDVIPQSEMDALRGVFPKTVHFHIKR